MKRTAIFVAALNMLLLFGFVFAPCAGALGSAPECDNLELSTRRNIPVAVKGDIELMDNGVIVYTPRTGKKGKDYFGYRAKDAAGNVSQEATAIIRIEK